MKAKEVFKAVSKTLDKIAGHLIAKGLVGGLLWFYFMVWHGRKVKIIGKLPKVPQRTVFICNHPSLVDTVLMPILWWPVCLWRIKSMPHIPAAKENYFPGNCRKIPVLKSIPVLRNWPVFAWINQRGNAIPVKIGRKDPAVLRRMVEIIKAGGNILIFPEGGRTRDVETGLDEFRLGLAALIMMSQPHRIIPIWLDGTSKILPIGQSWPNWKKGSVIIKIGNDVKPACEELCEFLTSQQSGKWQYKALMKIMPQTTAENAKEKIRQALTLFLRDELLILRRKEIF